MKWHDPNRFAYSNLSWLNILFTYFFLFIVKSVRLFQRENHSIIFNFKSAGMFIEIEAEVILFTLGNSICITPETLSYLLIHVQKYVLSHSQHTIKISSFINKIWYSIEQSGFLNFWYLKKLSAQNNNEIIFSRISLFSELPTNIYKSSPNDKIQWADSQ